MCATVLALALLALPAGGDDDVPKAHPAGPYSFSDELGGFRILSARGEGTAQEPVVIQAELNSASAVTMIIRAIRPVRMFGTGGGYADGFLRMVIVVRNASGLAWTEFEFELQELLGQPSVFGDGLSFDQRRTDTNSISSDVFSRYDRNFEPFDRVRFLSGHVDPGESADFGFLISDFTPRSQFYLVLDPRIPFS